MRSDLPLFGMPVPTLGILLSLLHIRLVLCSPVLVAFRIVVVNYAAILFILGSFRPFSVTEFMWVHFLSSPDQRFGFAFLAAA
jgi:hypothetical protein